MPNIPSGTLRVEASANLSAVLPGAVGGRVLAYINGSWGALCSSGWDRSDAVPEANARVVCAGLRAMGGGSQQHQDPVSGVGIGPGDERPDSLTVLAVSFPVLDPSVPRIVQSMQCAAAANGSLPSSILGCAPELVSPSGGGTCRPGGPGDVGILCAPGSLDIGAGPVAWRLARDGDPCTAAPGGCSQGRLETNVTGAWGTVCCRGTGWDNITANTAAAAACRTIDPVRFETGAVLAPIRQGPVPAAVFGPGAGPVWLDDWRCPPGANVTLSDCARATKWNRFVTDCSSHAWDVGLVCGLQADADAALQDSRTVRLVPLAAPLAVDPPLGQTGGTVGRLEVSYLGTWGTVCSEGWDKWGGANAHAACQAMGYNYGAPITGSLAAGPQQGPLWLTNLNCTAAGTDNATGGPLPAEWWPSGDGPGVVPLAQCGHRSWGLHTCNHALDVGLICQNELRLVDDSGTPSQSAGRLEVKYFGVWGGVCLSNSWRVRNVVNEQVVCNVVTGTVSGEAASFSAASQPPASGVFWLQDLSCTDANATSIMPCPRSSWGVVAKPCVAVAVQCGAAR